MRVVKPNPACLVLTLMLAAPCVEAGASGRQLPPSNSSTIAPGGARTAPGGHLGPDDAIRDLLRHPAFTGYAPLILPWDGREYDEGMRLREVGSLLPYHSHVDPETVTDSLNYMIDEIAAGRPVFNDIYSEVQKRAQPDRNHAGLFFFRGEPGAPFAVIAPGGGFAYVGSVHEGFPYAVEIARQGLNAFVLKYRTGLGGRMATEDLAAAISHIFRNAGTLGVDTRGYSLWGSSAGARMAAAIGTRGVAAYGGDELPKPAAIVMAYTAHSDHGPAEPPTFVVVGERDGISPPSAMLQRVAALRRSGVAVEYREYPGLGHGFGPGVGTGAEGWLVDAVRFWKRFVEPVN